MQTYELYESKSNELIFFILENDRPVWKFDATADPMLLEPILWEITSGRYSYNPSEFDQSKLLNDYQRIAVPAKTRASDWTLTLDSHIGLHHEVEWGPAMQAIFSGRPII